MQALRALTLLAALLIATSCAMFQKSQPPKAEALLYEWHDDKDRVS